MQFKEITQSLQSSYENIFSIEKIWLSQKQKISFIDSLYNLIHAGIPITNSLSILLYQTRNKKIRKIIETLLKDINRWKKLEDGFARFPKIFSIFDIQVIKMWEFTGKASNALETIKLKEEKSQELKSKVIGALIYPMIVVTLAIAMIIWFLVFIIPRVEEMYSDAHINLPGFTQKVIDISNFLQEYYIFLLGWLFFSTICFIIFKTHRTTKIYFDRALLKMPIFGGLIQKKILALYAFNLWTLLESGIMIHTSLEITQKSLENAFYEKRIDSVIEEVNAWVPLSDSMGIKRLKTSDQDPHFPLELSSTVRIWEKTWKLPSLLLRISEKFNRESDTIIKWLSNAIEPVVIIGVGIVVGLLVMAILLPFFNMVNVIW